MKYFVLSLFSICLSLTTWSFEPDTSKTIVEKGLEAIKLQKAKGLMDAGDYDAALGLFRKHLNDDPNNALINFYMGQVLFHMKKNNDALVYLDKASRIEENPHKEFHYVYAKTLQKMGKFDEAKGEMEKFVGTLKENEDYYLKRAKLVLDEIEYAEGMMKNPVEVEIANLGDAINSKYDEYGPAIASDGKTIIFTSRRPDTKGGARDPYDSKFLEDIYMATWNDELNAWNSAEPVPGRINTEDHDGCLSLSPDGTEIYVYRNEGDAGFGAGDIYIGRKLSSGKFSPAKRVPKPINSSYFESSASVTKDGNKMYFISEREKGGLGRADIYVSEKLGRNEWSDPKNLGSKINTKDDERMVFIHPEGNVIFFSSNGRNSIGGYDIYKSVMQEDGQWSEPVNVGYPINTVDDEINFTMTEDNKKAFISAYLEEGFGALDIYEVDLSKYDIMKDSPKGVSSSKEEEGKAE